MKSLLNSLMRAIARIAHAESGEFLPAWQKSRRLKEYLPQRRG